MLKFAFSFILICTSFVSYSQDQALLYEISGKELRSPSYVFGTFHMLCESDFVLSDSIKSKLQHTEQLVLELDMDDPKMMGAMMAGIKMKNGIILKDLYSKSDYDFMEKYFVDSLNLSLKSMAGFKPFLLYSLIIPQLLDCPVVAFELELMKLAKIQNKEVFGLETFEFQMEIFDAIPYKKQAEYLLENIRDAKSSRKEMQNMFKMYLKRDISGLEKLISESDLMFKDFEDILLKKRNLEWISKIIDFSKKKSTFFAVGAGHLSGNNGILQLLKNEGYTIKSIE
jgi:uncharacterized protein YbaP (TraB family)